MTPEEMATHKTSRWQIWSDQRSLKWVHERALRPGRMLGGGVQLGDVGDKVTSSRNGKGLDSRTPSSSPGVGY